MKKIKNLMFTIIITLTIFIFTQNVFANQIIQDNNSNTFHRKNKVQYNFRPYIYELIELQVTDKGQIHNFNFMHYRN